MFVHARLELYLADCFQESFSERIPAIDDPIFAFTEQREIACFGYFADNGERALYFSNLGRPLAYVPAVRHEPV